MTTLPDDWITQGNPSGQSVNGPALFAEAILTETRILRAHDPQSLLDERLTAYARAALSEGIGEVTFLWYKAKLGIVRVWITAPTARPNTRELRMVEAGELHDLTDREIDVLTLVACGFTNPEISTILGIQPKTVTTHVTHILQSLQQPTRAAAAAIAVDQGLMLLPIPRIAEPLPDLEVCRLQAVVNQQDKPRRPTAAPRLHRAPLRIGFLVPEGAGPEAADMREAGLLAIMQCNERGGIAGHLVEQKVMTCDVFNADRMRETLHTLAEDGTDALVFGYNMDYPRMGAFLEAVANYQIPAIHASTSGLAIDYVNDNPGSLGNIFHICGREELYGPGFVRFLAELLDGSGYPRGDNVIAAIAPPAGLTVFDEDAQASVERLGWKIEHIDRPSAINAPNERAAVLQALGNADPDVVFAPTFMDEALLADILDWRADNPKHPLVYSLFTPSFAGFIDRVGTLGEGLVWSTLTGTYADQLSGIFRNRFKAAFGRSPGFSQAGVHYDAVSMLLRAWAEADHPRNPRAVNARLREMVHRGINGSYWLGGPGQAPLTLPDHTLDASLAQAQLIYQTQHGRHRIIGPAPYSEVPFTIQPR
ncbi:MAG: LuxR C-terminal-related transcriptional regulator [Brooklawnia sp.]|jgi:branched-chain amino acid transport system substrate-binding protein